MKVLVFLTALIVVLAGIIPAFASFSSVGYSGETNTRQILNNIYNVSFTGSNWGGTSYTSSQGISAVRMNDFFPSGALNPQSIVADKGSNTVDQIWSDGVLEMSAEARFAGYSQQFGFITGTSHSEKTYMNLFNVQGSGFNVSGGKENWVTPHLWRWARSGTNGPQSSLDVDNADGRDHMISYQITGLTGLQPNEKVWVLFFEDMNKCQGSDFDYNDLVVEIRALPQQSPTAPVPVPGAIILGMIGLGLVAAWVKGRFA